MRYNKFLILLLASLPLSVSSQKIQTGYVDRGVVGSAFPEALKTWEKGQKWSEDDNFFISRVRPHVRFRNIATQVNPNLTEENDKKLIFWVPINNLNFNALPDGVFESEVFPMWSYVTHYGNWSAPLVRVPAGFLDVAHKNGVPVSALATIPYGDITDEWKNALTSLTQAGASKLSDYLLYYGVDGIGYNSEFQSSFNLVYGLKNLNQKTIQLMKEQGNPIADIIWYDGTNYSGNITFDNGLDTHNRELWGTAEAPASSLFLNYNWNKANLLDKSVANAKEFGRSPLDLYCGINMQGREPSRNKNNIWTLLERYPLSIGLWGAHSENMFFESRADQGPSPMKRQQTYFKRMLNWFTNGANNPIASLKTINSLVYSSEKDDFMGMSKMMSARSALKWNLDDEPFITYFNLGNGRFFNWEGERSHNSEWYNIAVQDYLPTWMWWFSSNFLGRDANTLVENGLKAEYTWDDAWLGGSTIRVHGSSAEEYLHLFKTEFALKSGDEITFRYKLLNGSADASIAMSLKGDEENPVSENSMHLMNSSAPSVPGVWTEKKFIVGKDITVSEGGEVAMIALHFKNAKDLDLRFGEFSIKRPSALKSVIETPIVESSKLLSAYKDGVDGKIIFNMPNDIEGVCYNSDVNTSLFKLYAEYDGAPAVLMGVTTSWAGLMFSVPYNFRFGPLEKVRFGVSALALDHQTESEIAWGEWHNIKDAYKISDEIVISRAVINPNEGFKIKYSDPRHEAADWKLIDPSGTIVAESKGENQLNVTKGLKSSGIYDLAVKGFESGENGRVETTRVLKGFVQVTDESTGSIPEILSIDIPESERYDIDGAPDYVHEYWMETDRPTINYTIDPGDAQMSRGVKVGNNAIGFKFKDSGLEPLSSFAVSFWFKPENFSDKSIHAFNIRHKGDPWAVNNWGWMWHTLTEDGRSNEFTIRMASGKDASYRFDNMKLYPGAWYNIAYSFEFDDNYNVKPALFINGERQTITSWSLGDEVQEGDVDFVGPTYTWKNENVVAFGGYLHKTGSVRGSVDNFMVWDKAISEEEAAYAMSDIKTEELPEDVVGYYDFESEPDKYNRFVNNVPFTFPIGIHGYNDTEVEGQSILEWRVPEYCAGCPFTSGESFSLTPTITWDVPGASILGREDNGKDGYVKLFYHNPGETGGYHPVNISVENEYGESKDKFMLHLLGFDSVDSIVANHSLEVYPKVFDAELGVKIAESGKVRLYLYSMEGRCVLANDFNASENEVLRIHPDVSSGVYILRAEKDGHLLGTAKVIRR